MELIDLWRILWRRKWTAAVTFLLIAGTCLVATLILPSVYRSNAVILVQQPVSESYLTAAFELAQAPQHISATIQNVYQMATSEKILNPVIDQLQLVNRKGKRLTAEKLASYRLFIAAVRPRPFVEVDIPDDKADLVEISAEDTDPEKAARIVQTLINVLKQDNLERKQKDRLEARSLLQEKIDELQANYLTALNDILSYKTRNQILDLEEETNSAIDVLSGLADNERNLVLSIAANRARIDTLKSQLASQSDDKLSNDTVNDSTMIQSIKSSILGNELQLAEELTLKMPDHPDITAIRQKLKMLRADLAREVETFKSSAGSLEALMREMASLEEQHVKLKALTSETVKRFASIPQKAAGIQRLGSNYTLASQLYFDLIAYGVKLDIMESTLVPDFRIVSGPTVQAEDDPEKPRLVLNVVIGILLGLMMGIGAAFIREQADDTVRTEADLPEGGPAVLGRIPKLKRKHRRRIQGLAAASPEAAAFQRVRNRIRQLGPGIRSVVITSAQPRDGKALVCAGLGSAMAACGQSVLLIDLDLRRPRLHRLFGADLMPGLTDLVRQERTVGEVIRTTSVPGLSLMTAGGIPDNPVKALESQFFSGLIKDLEEQYDMILMNTPPILPVDDALIAASLADACISVIRIGSCTRASLAREAEIWQTAGTTPLGVILNQTST